MKRLFSVLALCVACRASGQQVNLFVSGAAHRSMTAGFDTARVECVFCVHWHEAGADSVALDSAYVPQIDSSDVYHVWYKNCPRGLATAHWHLLDLGAIDHRSAADSATLVDFPAPFGVLIMRRHRGDRIPTYVYYDR
jgi:hypothetical protein